MWYRRLIQAVVILYSFLFFVSFFSNIFLSYLFVWLSSYFKCFCLWLIIITETNRFVCVSLFSDCRFYYKSRLNLLDYHNHICSSFFSFDGFENWFIFWSSFLSNYVFFFFCKLMSTISMDDQLFGILFRIYIDLSVFFFFYR